MSPKKYRRQIDDLGIEGLEIDVSSVDNAMKTLDELEEFEKILKKIRYNVKVDIRKIRMDYINELHEFETSSKNHGFFHRKKSTKKLIKEKKAIITHRDNKIATYEQIDDLTSDYIDQIEDSKIYVEHTIKGFGDKIL
jgi:ribosome recycling factor